MRLPVQVSTTRQETKNTFLIQTHESFRKELLQRENNFISELSVFIAAITGFGVYIGKHDFRDPGILLLVMGGAILVSFLGIHLCNLHGYQFRFCLFQLHKTECLLGMCDTSLLKWHRYCSYLIASQIKTPNEYKSLLAKKSPHCIGCQMFDTIQGNLKSGILDKFLNPLKIEPPNVVSAFRNSFYVLICTVSITAIIITYKQWNLYCRIWEQYSNKLCNQQCQCCLMIVVVIVLFVMFTNHAMIKHKENLKEKFESLVSVEFPVSEFNLDKRTID